MLLHLKTLGRIRKIQKNTSETSLNFGRKIQKILKIWKTNTPENSGKYWNFEKFGNLGKYSGTLKEKGPRFILVEEF